MQVLSEKKWHNLRRELKKKVDGKLKAYFVNRSKSSKHPVIDFLFEYYSFRLSELKNWSPGVGVALLGASALELLKNPLYKQTSLGVVIDINKIPHKRKNSLEWILNLLQTTSKRMPFLGCLGLHEWAMVYGSQKTRHNIPLRMSMEDIKTFVDNNRIQCSHYDAYRFFTKAAIPLNELRPTKEERGRYEQPGCLHTNMDLYKWAHKFYPWISSEIIFDTFELAWQIREVDMRASPYDLKDFGYKPILLETPSGRQEYIERQKDFFEKSIPLRQRLIKEYQSILEM